MTLSDLKLILRFLYNFSVVWFVSFGAKASNLILLLPLAGGVIIRLRCLELSVYAVVDGS